MSLNTKPLYIVFKSISVSALDVFVGNTDAEKYGSVDYDCTDDTIVDFKLKVLTFAIDSDTIIVEFPNHNTGCFKLNNSFYYMIEVI